MTTATAAATAPMSIRLDVTARDRLKAIAVRQKRTPHALATEAINLLIEQQEREFARQTSRDDALKHVDETGLHAAHEEIAAWMNSWGSGRELPAPVARP